MQADDVKLYIAVNCPTYSLAFQKVDSHFLSRTAKSLHLNERLELIAVRTRTAKRAAAALPFGMEQALGSLRESQVFT